MAVIAAFPPAVPTEPEAFARIRRLSRPLEWLFTLLFGLGAILLGVAVVAVLFYVGTRLQVRPGGMQIFIEATAPPLRPGWTTVGALPLIQKLALAASASLMMGPALAVLWSYDGFFGFYGAGIVLTARNASCMARIALWLIAYAVAPTIGHVVVTLAGFDDEDWLRIDSVKALALGLILLVVAKVMAWGAEVHDDALAVRLMPIILRLDVMMARRKVRSNVLARAIGISETNLSLLKSGKVRGLRFTTLDAICRYLDCTPSDLLEYVPESDDLGETGPLRTQRKTG